MAAPAAVRFNLGAVDTAGAWSYTATAAAAAGNVYIVHLLQDGTDTGANQPDITSVTNAENLAGTDNVLTKIGAFDVGTTPSAYQHIWIGRALNTSAMVITGANAGGDDVYVRVYEFQNVNTGSAITDVIENATAGTTVNSVGVSATASDASVTTLGADRLALNFLAINDDNAFPAAFTGQSGGTWSLRASYAESTGTDGALYLLSADMATAGTIDGGTGSITDSDAWGVVGFALIGTTVGSGTNANAGVATGTGTADF